MQALGSYQSVFIHSSDVYVALLINQHQRKFPGEKRPLTLIPETVLSQLSTSLCISSQRNENKGHRLEGQLEGA